MFGSWLHSAALISGIEVWSGTAETCGELEVLGFWSASEAHLTNKLLSIFGSGHHAAGSIVSFDHNDEVISVKGRDGQVAHQKTRAVVIVCRKGFQCTLNHVAIEDAQVNGATIELNIGDNLERGDGAFDACPVGLRDRGLHENGRVDLVLFHLALDVILWSGGNCGL